MSCVMVMVVWMKGEHSETEMVGRSCGPFSVRNTKAVCDGWF